MSKHIFEQTIEDDRYQVQIGWDKPTQQFYGVIEGWVNDDETIEDSGYFGEVIWSNLFEEYALSLEEITEVCHGFGLSMPEGLIENVWRDYERNAVNEVSLYTHEEGKTHGPEDFDIFGLTP